MSGPDQIPNRMHYTERLKLHEVDAATHAKLLERLTDDIARR